MSLKLNSSGGGGVTLSAANTATDKTITVPAVDGTMLTTASTFAGTGPAFSAYNSVATTIANGAAGSQVALQTEVFDTAGCFDTSTWKFTPNVAGYYQLNGAVSFGDATMTASAVYGGISKNGTDVNTLITRQMQGGFTTGYVQFAFGTLVYLNGTTDYVCLVAYQNQGSTRATQTGAAYTYFNGFLARAA